ncbi:Hypothetical predicted protein [Mytilus galloprovincialis]|uniref:Uncharacterized protein n=1 Tax=Mytilus galloprovincialis TaxID=29158 RepID=A0A8B6CW24_MYTGA|nr:Hypothetical predicted protein [Mytilus galloprovincialis]
MNTSIVMFTILLIVIIGLPGILVAPIQSSLNNVVEYDQRNQQNITKNSTEIMSKVEITLSTTQSVTDNFSEISRNERQRDKKVSKGSKRNHHISKKDTDRKHHISKKDTDRKHHISKKDTDRTHHISKKDTDRKHHISKKDTDTT